MPSAFSLASSVGKFIPLSWIASAGNARMRMKGDDRRFEVDPSGNWLNIQAQATIASPELHTAQYSQIKAAVASHWFHHYTPRSGDVVIDVGAGIGEDAVVLSHLVGPEGRVHAIEAHPRIFNCLAATIARSKLGNVDSYALAIAERDGTITISDSDQHLGNSIVGTEQGISVEAQSLDHFIERTGHRSIDLLKINIEGAERPAVLGLDKQAAKIKRMAISCHDFIADQGGGDHYRTKDAVRRRLVELDFAVTERPDADTPWEADVLFASRNVD